MARNIQKRGNKWQLRKVHDLLPRDFFQTFDSELEATNFRDRLDAWLAEGLVPPGLFGSDPLSPLLVTVIRDYTFRATPKPTASDSALLDVLLREVEGLRVSGVTFQWAESYVKGLKAREKKPTPGTIRKRVGALARVLDWHFRDVRKEGQPLAVNALRLLPSGYSTYEDNAVRDVHRDLRFGPGDAEALDAVLDGVKRPDRERPFPADPAFKLLFETIVDTGLRLREAYWLRVEQLDVARGLLNVDGTKGHRGVIKPRTVPLKPALRKKLIDWCRGKAPKSLMFPFWDGTPEDLHKCSARLSARFSNLFDYAGVEKFTEHDLRHESCCRWMTLKNPAAGWVFNEIEICKIMGWSDTKIMLRYASLRGEDLSSRLL